MAVITTIGIVRTGLVTEIWLGAKAKQSDSITISDSPPVSVLYFEDDSVVLGEHSADEYQESDRLYVVDDAFVYGSGSLRTVYLVDERYLRPKGA